MKKGHSKLMVQKYNKINYSNYLKGRRANNENENSEKEKNVEEKSYANLFSL